MHSGARRSNKEDRDKDNAFKYADESAIPYEEIEAFARLNHYPANAKYRFKLRLQNYSSARIVDMTTSRADNGTCIMGSSSTPTQVEH